MDIKFIDRALALGNLISEAGLGYIEANNNFQITSWNDGAKAMLGITEDEAQGRSLNDFFPLDQNELSNCESVQLLTATAQGAGGRKIQCDIYYDPIINLKGERLGIAVLVREVTDKAEGNDTAPLNYQDSNLRDVFDFAPVGIYHVDLTGNVDLANPEFAWMLGYESADITANRVSDFASQMFYDLEKAEEFLFSLNEADEVKRSRYKLKKRDKSSVWALCYAKTTRDIDGRKNGFMGFSIDISETVRAEQSLQKANEKLKMLSVIDGLTQIPNRRRFDEYLDAEWKRHFREKTAMAVILSDIDFFKFYNDNYGHQAGDDCLQKVARAIHDSTTRSTDLAARYGGEEFAIILPNTDLEGALTVAERVRTNVLKLELEHEKSKVGDHVSLSLGVAAMVPGSDNTAEGLVALADGALYQAKESGRNQSVGKQG